MERVNILLVDDQQGKLLSYQAMLSQLGENLVLAKSGREALQLLLRQEFALILLDVIMPDMDGFETASLIRQHPRLEQVPIIFVTAFSVSDMDRLKGYEVGAVDYVFVPIVPEILRAKVAAFVELYRKKLDLEYLNQTLDARVAERTAELEEAASELEETNRRLETEIEERKQAEEAVRELNANLEQRVLERTAQLEAANKILQKEIAERERTETKFRGLLEAAPDAMLIVGKDARIVIVNGQAEKLFGYQRDELIGQSVEIVIPERFRKRHTRHFAGFFANPIARPMGVNLVLYGVRKNRTEFPVEISLSPVATEEGPLIISAIRDITERKQAEEERAKLAAIVESSEDAIISMTSDGIITSWNPGAEKIYGYAAAEAKGKHISIIASPDHLNELSNSIERITRGESVENYEAKRITKDGKEIDVSLSQSAIKDAGGEITAISKIARDITARKRSEEALSSQTRILHSILVSMADAVIVVDAEGKLLLFNPAAEQLQSVDSTGENNKETERHGYGIYLPDMVTLYPKDELPLNRVLSGETAKETEMFVRTPTAPMGIWLSTIARPLKDEDGVLQGGVAVLRDITTSKMAERKLRNSREQLRNLSAHIQSVREQERARIAREIHDQLGQTLTALRMDLSWLAKRLSSSQKALLERTLAMCEIIDMTIQTVQRISAELRPGLLDDLGLSTAVEWQAEQFRERTEIDCTVKISPEHIVVDRERSTEMFRIFQEILTNVARHANATHVKIDLIKRDKKLALKVRDNGKGISRSEICDSKSLGLIGMQERVYPWKGKVRIAGAPGRGTIVYVTIPLNSRPMPVTDLISV